MKRQRAGRKKIRRHRQTVPKEPLYWTAGMGGFDPGKESSDGILEKHINLAIAERLKELLEKEGIRVVMTRTRR